MFPVRSWLRFREKLSGHNKTSSKYFTWKVIFLTNALVTEKESTAFPELMIFYTSILQEYSSLYYTPSPKKNPPPDGGESFKLLGANNVCS